MQVLSVISTKGGISKTATVANLGGFLADTGLRVVDLEVQPTLSSYFMPLKSAVGGRRHLRLHFEKPNSEEMRGMMPADIQLPVGQIYPDPERLFRSARRDQLDELARSMAAIGLIHPVIVCREGLRWLLVCGERRLEAARRLGWEKISARPMPCAPPALRSIIRAAENLHRSSFSLIEMTDVVLSVKEAGMPVEVVAQALGRPTAWVEGLLGMARDPVARVLLDADRLASVEAWKQFVGLRPAARKQLLQCDEPITRERCERAARGRRRPPRSSAERRGRAQDSRA